MLDLCSKGSLEDHVPALSDSLRFYFLNVRFSESIIIAVIKSNTMNMFEYPKYKREIMTVSSKAISSLPGPSTASRLTTIHFLSNFFDEIRNLVAEPVLSFNGNPTCEYNRFLGEIARMNSARV